MLISFVGGGGWGNPLAAQVAQIHEGYNESKLGPAGPQTGKIGKKIDRNKIKQIFEKFENKWSKWLI